MSIVSLIIGLFLFVLVVTVASLRASYAGQKWDWNDGVSRKSGLDWKRQPPYFPYSEPTDVPEVRNYTDGRYNYLTLTWPSIWRS